MCQHHNLKHRDEAVERCFGVVVGVLLLGRGDLDAVPSLDPVAMIESTDAIGTPVFFVATPVCPFPKDSCAADLGRTCAVAVWMIGSGEDKEIRRCCELDISTCFEGLGVASIERQNSSCDNHDEYADCKSVGCLT